MDVVFNINSLGLEGLGATLTSLVRNCANNKELKLWFLCSGLKQKDKNNINGLLTNEKFEGGFEFVDFNAKEIFGHLRSLHGDWTAYGRLLIPQYVKADAALYLDADLIIQLDVLELKGFEFNNSLLAAVYGGPVKNALENSFFINELNWAPETGYFNSGVLLFNLQKWRADNIEKQWKSIAAKYPDGLVSHDQTLLNAISEGKFAHIPKAFNTVWFPFTKKPAGADKAILHFVGSPKPWDIFGSIIHEGFATWRMYDTPFWQKHYRKITVDKMRRTWKIRRSVLRTLKKKIGL